MQSRIKEFFTSRYGDVGYLVEVDFSQLEVIGLAILSGDKNLKKDILDGVDLHCMSASFLSGATYNSIWKAVHEDEDEGWIKTRKQAKSVSFAAQYGAGATTISKNTGLPKEAVEEFLRNYYKRYVDVGRFQDSVAEEVLRNRKPSKFRTEKGQPAGVGYYISPTKRRYVFREFDAPEWTERRTSFSPTQMKNFPVQGMSTGDVVPLALGKLLRALKADKKLRSVLLVNTIHDSVLLDVPEEHLDDVASLVKGILENTPKFFENTFHVAFDLPLKVDIEYGRSWSTLKSY